MKKLFTVLLILFVYTVPALAASKIDMKDGEWEITTKIEMTGMPMQIPPQTHTQCITQKDLIPQNSKENEDCKIKNMKTSGNTVSWEMECNSENGKTSGSGKITYSGDKLKGIIKMSISGNIKMTNKISGKRLGACK